MGQKTRRIQFWYRNKRKSLPAIISRTRWKYPLPQSRSSIEFHGGGSDGDSSSSSCSDSVVDSSRNTCGDGGDRRVDVELTSHAREERTVGLHF
jgi:hypothetical protein